MDKRTIVLRITWKLTGKQTVKVLKGLLRQERERAWKESSSAIMYGEKNLRPYTLSINIVKRFIYILNETFFICVFRLRKEFHVLMNDPFHIMFLHHVRVSLLGFYSVS